MMKGMILREEGYVISNMMVDQNVSISWKLNMSLNPIPVKQIEREMRKVTLINSNLEASVKGWTKVCL
jgi:hypothetical protein